MAIKVLSVQHRISILCRVLKVNRSTYYKYVNRQPSRRERENMAIKRKIAEHYAASDKRLGARKMKVVLMREDCISVSEGRVYRLMKEMNLPKMSTVKPPGIRRCKGDEGRCENLPSQRFDQTAPNRVWACDFTYVAFSDPRATLARSFNDTLTEQSDGTKILQYNKIARGIATLLYWRKSNGELSGNSSLQVA